MKVSRRVPQFALRTCQPGDRLEVRSQRTAAVPRLDVRGSYDVEIDLAGRVAQSSRQFGLLD